MISTRSQVQKKAQVDDDIECCVCFTSHEEDIVNQSGKDWVAYVCGRWLYEDCADDCILDSAGKETLP